MNENLSGIETVKSNCLTAFSDFSFSNCCFVFLVNLPFDYPLLCFIFRNGVVKYNYGGENSKDGLIQWIKRFIHSSSLIYLFWLFILMNNLWLVLVFVVCLVD